MSARLEKVRTPGDSLTTDCDIDEQCLLAIVVFGSPQPKVNVKHTHPFCLKGVELFELLIFNSVYLTTMAIQPVILISS